MIALRSLNDAGLTTFVAFLRDAAVDPRLDPPWTLLEDDELSENVRPESLVDPSRKFSTRLDFAEYLAPILDPLDGTEIESAIGMWSWIALLYFDQLCPSREGVRKVGDLYRYALNGGVPGYNFRRSVRHLVYSPVSVFRLHRTSPPLSLLCQPVSIHPDMAEQLASYQELISVPSVVQAADKLYYDANSRAVRRGSTDRKGRGTIRRLIAVCSQLDRTYDLSALTPEELVELLPSEFDRFR